MNVVLLFKGGGLMGETIHFETLNVLPLMHIEKALYGHPSNIVKVGICSAADDDDVICVILSRRL